MSLRARGEFGMDKTKKDSCGQLTTGITSKKLRCFFDNDEPDWSTVSFLERWFLVFRFHQHEKFLCLEFLSADDVRFISWFLPKF